jgi:hypothetical protein
MNEKQCKISILSILLLISALFAHSYPVTAQQKGASPLSGPRVMKLPTAEDRWTLELERVTESPGVDQWIGGQPGQGMQSGFRNVIVKQSVGKATFELGLLSDPGSVKAKQGFSIRRSDGTTLRGTIAINGSVEQSVLRFTPSGSLSAFTLANGQSFPMQEVLFSEPNVDFSIAMPCKHGAEAITSFTVVDQLSNTPIKVTVTWRIKGPEEQLWEVDVTGHERIWRKYYYTYESNRCQEPYGERLQSPTGKKPLSKIVENKRGAVFHFHLTAEVTLRKKNGAWYYYQGKISRASVRAQGLYTPEKLVQVKKVLCPNCANITGLTGSSLAGELTHGKLKLLWPDRRVSAEIYACTDDPCILETGFTGMKSCGDLSAMASSYAGTRLTEFMDRMSDHELALLEVPQKFPVNPSLKAKDIFEWNYNLVKLR